MSQIGNKFVLKIAAYHCLLKITVQRDFYQFCSYGNVAQDDPVISITTQSFLILLREI